MGFDNSHMNFHSVKEVMPTSLKQYGQEHVCGAHEREVSKALNVFPHRFSSFLDRQEEFIHGHLGVILVESREELGFQVNPEVDGAVV